MADIYIVDADAVSFNQHFEHRYQFTHNISIFP